MFAGQVLRFSAWAGAAMLALMILVAVYKASIAWTVVIGLLTIAAVLAAGGIAVALIDLRGRARASAIVARDAKGLGSDTVQAASNVLKAWGTLGVASAMLALAAIAMIAATTLGWRSLPEPGPATPTPSASSNSSPSPTGSESASTPTPTTPPSPATGSAASESASTPPSPESTQT